MVDRGDVEWTIVQIQFSDLLFEGEEKDGKLDRTANVTTHLTPYEVTVFPGSLGVSGPVQCVRRGLRKQLSLLL